MYVVVEFKPVSGSRRARAAVPVGARVRNYISHQTHWREAEASVRLRSKPQMEPQFIRFITFVWGSIQSGEISIANNVY